MTSAATMSYGIGLLRLDFTAGFPTCICFCFLAL